MTAKYSLEVKWGFIHLGMTLFWMLLEKMLGLHASNMEYHALVTNFYFLPVILIYTLALREHGKGFPGGAGGWKGGFFCGFRLTLVITFLSPLGQVLIHQVISPEYFAKARALAVEKGIVNAADAAAYFSLKSYVVQTLLGSFIGGLIISGAIAFFLRPRVPSGDR